MGKTLRKITAFVAAAAAALSITACSGKTDDNKSELDWLKQTVEDLADKVEDLTAENGTLADKNGELTEKIDDLIAENGALSDKIDDLTTENGALSDKIDSLNVFTSDKKEYGEHETMTVYFKKNPVLKIRLSFDNIYGTALFSGSVMNHAIRITSLCADIYAETIIGTSFAESNVGTFVRSSSAGTKILKQNQEVGIVGQFDCSDEAYNSSIYFDIVICVPGTPFELARFKNVSHYDE